MTSRGAVAVIPVRLGSARLPGKALLSESGRPLFLHTTGQAMTAGCFDEVVVATDSEDVASVCDAAGVRAIMTSSAAPTGSARCAEALCDLGEPAVVVNVQADWPEVPPEDLEQLVGCLRANPDIPIATLSCPLEDVADFENPHVVKLVTGNDGRALYFSRAAIPGSRSDAPGQVDERHEITRRHLGVYGFQATTLASLARLPDSPLEGREGLEQLRWLAAGLRIQVLASSGSPRGIETRADYDAFVDRISIANEN